MDKKWKKLNHQTMIYAFKVLAKDLHASQGAKVCGILKVKSILPVQMVDQKGDKYGKSTMANSSFFAEPNNPDLVDNHDNLTVSPMGDLFICEDGKGDQFIDVVT